MRDELLTILEKNSRIDFKELAVLLGKSEEDVLSEISKLENEKINITIERLDAIANFFEVKTFELLIRRDG